jgi:Fe-S cluster biogenesis protein NfuA
MKPSHIPIVITVATIPCNVWHVAKRCHQMIELTHTVETLIQTNLGPLLDDTGTIDCRVAQTNVLQCDLYVTWTSSCGCCTQLKETFSSKEIETMIDTQVKRVNVECELPNRYQRCNVSTRTVDNSVIFYS